MTLATGAQVVLQWGANRPHVEKSTLTLLTPWSL